MGARLVWAMSNFIVFICMETTAIISMWSISEYSDGVQHIIGENKAIKVAALAIFSIPGFPLSVSFYLHISFPSIYSGKWLRDGLPIFSMLQITYSVPFSVTTELTSSTGGGQGLSFMVSSSMLFICSSFT